MGRRINPDAQWRKATTPQEARKVTALEAQILALKQEIRVLVSERNTIRSNASSRAVWDKRKAVVNPLRRKHQPLA